MLCSTTVLQPRVKMAAQRRSVAAVRLLAGLVVMAGCASSQTRSIGVVEEVLAWHRNLTARENQLAALVSTLQSRVDTQDNRLESRAGHSRVTA